MSLTLGGVTLDGFETPGGLRFGGAQALAVHKLPGGARVVDVIGRDDADVAWTGVFSGSTASDRARALDTLRASGATLPLAWDSFVYSVIIRELTLTYESPWWIPYIIRCIVLEDGYAPPAGGPTMPVSSVVLDDLQTAAGFTDLSATQAAFSLAGALTAGTAANAGAAALLMSAEQNVASGVMAAGAQLEGNDLAGVVSAAGSLASLLAARGYILRAGANLAQIDN